MGHDLTFRTALAAGLGLVAAAGNLVGGYFVVRRDWPRKYLQYFLALGAGYMLAGGVFGGVSGIGWVSGGKGVLFLVFGFLLVDLFGHTPGARFFRMGEGRVG